MTLPVWVKIAPGADPNLTPAAWPNWVRITDDVRMTASDRIEITEGRGSEDSDLETATFRCSLENGSKDGRVPGRYVMGNPLSPYPGLARNTPLCAGLTLATDGFSVPVVNGWGSPDGPKFDDMSWSISGPAADWDVASGVGTHAHAAPADNTLYRAMLVGGDSYDVYGEATFSTSHVSEGGSMSAGAVARYADTSNMYLLQLRFFTVGVINLRISRVQGGVFTDLAQLATSVVYSANERIRLAWQVVGSSLAVKAWEESGTEPDAWMLTAEDTELVEGSRNGLFSWRTSGNTNATTLTVSADDYLLEHVEFAGFVNEWPVNFLDLTGNNAVVPLTASGILARVRASDRGSRVVQSPLFRQLSGRTSAGYLPLEDLSGTVSAANATPGGRPGILTDCTAGVESDLPGAARVVKFNSDTSRIVMYPRQDLAKGTGFSFMWLMKFDSLPGSAADMITVATNTGSTVDRWAIRFDGATVNLRGYRRSTMTDVVTPASVFYSLDVTEWFAMELRLEVSGANTNWRLMWARVGAESYFSTNGSYAGTTVPYVTSIDFRSASPFTGAEFSHMWTGQNTLPFFSTTFLAVWSGFVGESDIDRWVRILEEAGISGYAESGTGQELGAQEIASALDIFRSIELAGQGRMFESGWGLAYRPRDNRYSRPVTLELDAADGGLGAQPTGLGDDSALVNDVTISRTGGAQGVRWTDEDHVAREGRYAQAPTVNIERDDRLLLHASWMVFLGTRPGYRWPRMVLNLMRRPDFSNDWTGRYPGARLQVTNAPAQLVGQAPDVIVEGTRTSWWHNEWIVEANCSNAAPWESPTLDDDDVRLDSDLSELDAAIDADDMSFVIDVVEGEPWITTAGYPAEFPLDLMINGEVITVSGIGAPAGTLQTATVSARAVNGVSRSHDAGSQITLARPFYLPL